MWVVKSSQTRYHEYVTSQRISRLRAVYQSVALREHMSDQCYLCEEALPEEFSRCWTCLEYRKETRNICLYCEQDGFAFFHRDSHILLILMGLDTVVSITFVVRKHAVHNSASVRCSIRESLLWESCLYL